MRSVRSKAKARCAGRASGWAACSASSASTLLPRQERQPAQEPADELVGLADGVLVEVVHAGQRGVQEDGALGRLAHLLALHVEQERAAQAEDGRLGLLGPPLDPADEVHPGGDVAPLVRAAHLQVDPVVAVEDQVVGRLERLVGELGERQAAAQALLDRLLLQHRRDREVLADLAQEVQQAVLAEPGSVVQQDRRVRPGGEVQEAPQLLPHGRAVAIQDRVVQQVPLRARARRVADHARAAADERHRDAAGALQVGQQEDLDEVAHVERRAGRIDAHVGADGAAGEPCLEAVGDDLGHAAPAQLGQEIGNGHASVALRRGERPDRARRVTMLESRPKCRPASHGASSVA